MNAGLDYVPGIYADIRGPPTRAIPTRVRALTRTVLFDRTGGKALQLPPVQTGLAFPISSRRAGQRLYLADYPESAGRETAGSGW